MVVLSRAFVVLTIIFTIAICLIWRELSWRHSYKKLKNNISTLENQIEALTLKLIIDEHYNENSKHDHITMSMLHLNSTNTSKNHIIDNITNTSSALLNSANGTAEDLYKELPMNLNLSFLEILTKKLQMYENSKQCKGGNVTLSTYTSNICKLNSNHRNLEDVSTMIFFDYSGYLIFSFILLFKFYELKYMHNDIYKESIYLDDLDCNNKYHEYIRHFYPVSTFVLFFLVFLLGCYLWFMLLFLSKPLAEYYTDMYITYSIKVIIINFLLTTPIIILTYNLLRIKKYFPNTSLAWKQSISKLEWWMWLGSRLIGVVKMEDFVKYSFRLFFSLLVIWPYKYYFYYRYICLNDFAISKYLLNVIITISLTFTWLSYSQIHIFGCPLWLKNSNFLKKCFPVTISLLVQMISLGILLLRTIWSIVFNRCSTYGMFLQLLFPIIYIYIAFTHASVITLSLYKATFAKWLGK